MASIVTNAETLWWSAITGWIITYICFLLVFLFFGNSKKYLIGQRHQLHFLCFTGWNFKILMQECINLNAKLKYLKLNNLEKVLGINILLDLLDFYLFSY